MLDNNFIGPVFRGWQPTSLGRVQTITPYLMPEQSAYPDRQECRTALHDQCSLSLHLTVGVGVKMGVKLGSSFVSSTSVQVRCQVQRYYGWRVAVDQPTGLSVLKPSILLRFSATFAVG